MKVLISWLCTIGSRPFVQMRFLGKCLEFRKSEHVDLTVVIRGVWGSTSFEISSHEARVSLKTNIRRKHYVFCIFHRVHSFMYHTEIVLSLHVDVHQFVWQLGNGLWHPINGIFEDMINRLTIVVFP